LQRTTATHAPFCSAPTAIVAGNRPPFPLSHLLPCVTYSITTTPQPSTPLAYKTPPTSSLNSYLAQSKAHSR
jgi:hypothetical protein